MLRTDDDKHDEETLREYLRRLHTIENELEVLREDRKSLNEEFKEKLDMKTLRQALTCYRTQQKVAHQFEFETFMKVLEEEGLPAGRRTVADASTDDGDEA